MKTNIIYTREFDCFLLTKSRKKICKTDIHIIINEYKYIQIYLILVFSIKIQKQLLLDSNLSNIQTCKQLSANGHISHKYDAKNDIFALFPCLLILLGDQLI